ncbi:MAG: hypothetical protein AAGA38_07870 [Pseudomonadota bacterium]
MTEFRTLLATMFGVLGALILVPFVAFFGLMIVGLTVGLSLIAAGTVTASARHEFEADPAETPAATAQSA